MHFKDGIYSITNLIKKRDVSDQELENLNHNEICIINRCLSNINIIDYMGKCYMVIRVYDNKYYCQRDDDDDDFCDTRNAYDIIFNLRGPVNNADLIYKHYASFTKHSLQIVYLRNLFRFRYANIKSNSIENYSLVVDKLWDIFSFFVANETDYEYRNNIREHIAFVMGVYMATNRFDIVEKLIDILNRKNKFKDYHFDILYALYPCEVDKHITKYQMNIWDYSEYPNYMTMMWGQNLTYRLFSANVAENRKKLVNNFISKGIYTWDLPNIKSAYQCHYITHIRLMFMILGELDDTIGLQMSRQWIDVFKEQISHLFNMSIEFDETICETCIINKPMRHNHVKTLADIDERYGKAETYFVSKFLNDSNI